MPSLDDEHTRIRRARALICYWNDGRLIVENYLTHLAAFVDPSHLRVLHVFDEWQTLLDALQALPKFAPDKVRDAVCELEKRNFLLVEGSDVAQRDAALAETWADWLPHGCFHFATKDFPFLHGEAERQMYEEYLAAGSPPPMFKPYPSAATVDLPQPAAPEGELLNVLVQRRTHREFDDAEVSLTAISTLLRYTWGVMRSEDTRFGPLLFKTSPSGGARNPIEVYLAAIKVRDLSPGVYHYNPCDHRLETVRGEFSAQRAFEYCAGQEHAAKASALFLMTSVFGRSMWKYRFPRAYRVVTLDAGHLGQTFCLLATKLGLGPFCTAAFDDSLIEHDLGLDGITESAIYVVGVGALDG